MDPQDNTLRFSGTVEFELTNEPGSARTAPPGGSSLLIQGTVVDVRTGNALPGQHVAAYAALLDIGDSRDSDSAAREVLLGRIDSDSRGGFRMLLGEDARVQGALAAILHSREPLLVLKVEDAHGAALFTSPRLVPVDAVVSVQLPIELRVEAPRNARWSELTGRLKNARVSRLDQIVRELVPPDGAPSSFSDWTLEQRLGVIAALEQAFLDPTGILRQNASPMPGFAALQQPQVLEEYQRRLEPRLGRENVRENLARLVGKVSSFHDLAAVDWPVDLDKLGAGHAGPALTAFEDRFRLSPVAIDRLRGPETDLTRYRDYLRAIWVDWASTVVYVQPHLLTKDQALDQLTTRFHQDFQTMNSVDRPANEVLIPIAVAILTAPARAGFGFGITPAAIPPRGAATAREYLDKLIALSGESATELGLRYRLNLSLPDGAISNPVQVNIDTLQGFFRDSFQCSAEPFHVAPDVHDQPIVPDKLQGKAPFFLHYDEWLRQQSPFYAENYFDVRRAFGPVQQTKENRDSLANFIKNGPAAERPDWTFIAQVVAVDDALVEGHTQYYRGEYQLAKVAYDQAATRALTTAQDKIALAFDPKPRLAKRKTLKVASIKDLPEFSYPQEYRTSAGTSYRNATRDSLLMALHYWALYVIPVCRGDVALAQGDYEKAVFHYGQATRFPVGATKESSTGGYRPHYLDGFPLYHQGDRPYTVNLHDKQYPLEADTGEYYDTTTYSRLEQLAVDLIEKYTHPIEAKLFRLRQGLAMLEWADALYRANDPSSIARARELYKGVLWLHGEIPPICPNWPREGLLHGFGKDYRFRNDRENPALTAQKTRARLGFLKIEAGLNYYGERDDLVPVLRYRPLKESADRMTALAKSAQQDFLLYLERLESATIERMKLANLLQKASLQVAVAGEQIALANYQVGVAQEQVKQVEAQIEAKKKEIADSESLFSQFSDFAAVS